MAFLDKFHKLIARKITVKGSEDTPIDMQTATGTSNFSVSNAGNVTVAGTLKTTGAQTQTGALTVNNTLTVDTSSASALTVGDNGATNPALKVDTSTASSATGLQIKSAAAASGLAVDVVSSGTNENLTIDAKGSGTITLGGTSTGAITLTRAVTLTNGLGTGATEAELTRVADASARIVALDATSLSVTAASHGERIVRMDHTAAASTATLPAASGTGNIYTFIVGAVNTNNHIIKVANASDTFEGIAFMANDTDNSVSGFETGATDDTITLNGTTTGGAAIGDRVELIDMDTNKWHILAHITGTGTEATPFSATV